MTESPPDSPGIPFPPPLVFMGALALGFLIHRLYPVGIGPASMRPLLATVGWILALSFLALFLPAANSFRRARTSILPNQPASTIVEVGPYRMSG